MRKRIVFVLSFVVASSVFAQVKESLTVSTIEVPVNVIGRDGLPVRGLTAANFELFDEGKKRMITGFESVDFASPERSGKDAATAPLNPAARRNFLLLFDLSYSNPHSLVRAETAAREFLDKSIKPRDRVAVGTLDVNRGFRLLAAFTTDRTLVARAIRDPRQFNGSDPLQITAIGPAPIVEPVNTGPNAPTSSEVRAEREAQFAAAQKELARKSADFDDQYRTHQIDKQLEFLAMISRTMHTVSGRKQIVLLSEGFDPRLVSGREKITQESVDEQTAIERGEYWKVNNDHKFGSSSSQKLLSDFAEMCHRSDVILNAIDIRGLRGNSDPQQIGDASVSNGGLHLLASAAGGMVFKNSNDIATDFDRMMHAQEVTYVLAFRAPTADPGTFHNLKVKVVGVGVAGAHVSHRAGYYEAGSGNEAERALETAEIMVNDIPQSDIHIDALPSVFPAYGEKAAVPVIVDIDGNDILRLKDDPIVVADIFVYAFDANGSVRDSLFQRLTIDSEKLAPKLAAAGVKYFGTLSLPPGQYAIKTLVRLPELGRAGFTRQDVTVPETNTVQMTQPLFFDDTARWILIRGTSHDAGGSYPFKLGENEFIPSAAAHLQPGQRRRFAVYVKNAPGDATVEVTPHASFVERNGDAFIFEIEGAQPKPEAVAVALKGTPLKASVPVQ
jgi:VWFA-related protein